ncbi:PAS domain-containing sensor histidine kinase [Pontibacter roseus]|uniref:PAS domain-containing sensor histidine kinase n=1 Tax=Pontibacter roseus TaxID=336989 RepID=UPI00039F827D|nr:PAS domain-containing sensor histidine kinase [Pontibacter roseus]
MSLVPEVVSPKYDNRLPDDYYRLLVDNIADYAVFMLDPTGHIISWNIGAELIKQYKAEEIIGQHFSVFYTAADINRDYPATELKEALKHGRYEDLGWRVRKDGTVFWANVIITPMYDKDKTLLGFSKVTRNLSEKKKAEEDLQHAYQELKESEEKFRLLIEGVRDYAIIMLDSAGNIASWNEGARRMKGYEANEIIGKYFSKFYSREDIERGFPEYELGQAKANGRFEDEGWRYRKDGSAYWANTVLTAVRDAQGQLLGFSKITRDLTDKKKLEQQLYRSNEELKESEEKSRLLINSVRDYSILMLSPDGIIMSWNEGAERIKGYEAKEVIGKHFSVFYPREAVAQGFPQFELKTALANGQFEDEGWRIRKDGTAFWANVVLSPIYNQNKRLLGFAKITRDLTERRRNEELMRRNLELVRINNELDSFVYTASHDLKSPVINLEGLLIALKEDLGADVGKHEALFRMMGGAVEKLKKTIDDLSDVTKLQQDKTAPEEVDIPAMIEEVKETLSSNILSKSVKITTATTGFESLRYSRKNVRSILFNLVSNAIKYANPAKTPEVTISTSVADTGEFVLSVADNGLGISEGQKSKIFGMFKRAHDHVEGSGVGLYLVKKILDNTGDRIEVESVQSEGSVFRVYFKQGPALPIAAANNQD